MSPYIPLAKAIAEIFIHIELSSAAAQKSTPRIDFYESLLFRGRIPITAKAARTMARTYIFGVYLILEDAPPCSWLWRVLPPTLPCMIQPVPIGTLLYIPWKTKIQSSSYNQSRFEQLTNEKTLYCPSPDEQAEAGDWWELERRRNSFSNRLYLSIHAKYPESILQNNLLTPAYPLFRSFVEKYYLSTDKKEKKFPENFSSLAQADFVPDTTDTIEVALKKVAASLRSLKNRNYDPIKYKWRDVLKRKVLQGVKWEPEKIDAFFQQIIPSGKRRKPKAKSPRWQTSCSLPLQTYALFIRYFIDKFLFSPENVPHFGEIICWIWIAVRAAQDSSISTSVKELLNLKISDVDFEQNIIQLSASADKVIELSSGLAHILSLCPVGEGQRLFSHLSEDRLEDIFKRVSEEILPGLPAALPGAFLIFPQSSSSERVTAKARKEERFNPPRIYHRGPTRQEVQRMVKPYPFFRFGD